MKRDDSVGIEVKSQKKKGTTFTFSINNKQPESFLDIAFEFWEDVENINYI